MRKYERVRLLTKEQDLFLRNNVKQTSNKNLTELMNKEFGLNLKESQINTYKKNHKLSSGLTGRFEKGHVPINKGTKGMFNIGGNSTSFKKGQVPLNYKPVGTERICKRDGYILIKVQDDGSQWERWNHKHKVVWEECNGPIPEGHVIAFADTDKQNVDISNLIMMSNAELAVMNRYDYISTNPEVTKATLSYVRLSRKVRHISFGVDDGTKLKELMQKAKRNGISESTFIARLERGWNMNDAINRPLHYRQKITRKG